MRSDSKQQVSMYVYQYKSNSIMYLYPVISTGKKSMWSSLGFVERFGDACNALGPKKACNCKPF